MNKYLKLLFLIILIFLMTNIIVFKIENFIDNQQNLKEHNEYFKKPLKEQQIEDWMTIHHIKQTYQIDRKEFSKITNNKSLKLKELKLTLKQYCDKKELDCEELKSELNKIHK